MDERKHGPDSIWIGVAIGCGVNVGVLLIAFFGRFPIILFGFGLVQVVWMLPLCLIFFGMEKKETAKGIGILAGLTFMLHVGICGAMLHPRLH
jgi:hypothetical protein